MCSQGKTLHTRTCIGNTNSKVHRLFACIPIVQSIYIWRLISVSEVWLRFVYEMDGKRVYKFVQVY